MPSASRWPRRSPPVRCPARRLGPDRGAQLLEFAFALPILLLLVAGAWDFGSAFLLHDKMTNGAREAARVAVSNPINTNPLNAPCANTGATPCSIVAAIDALKLYMTNAGIDLSCIDPNSPDPKLSSGLQYAYDCASVPLLEVVLDRGAVVSYVDPVTGLPVKLPATQVTFAYPVKKWWLAGFLPQGFFPPTLRTVVTMRNLI